MVRGKTALKVFGGIALFVAGGVAWWLISPLFISKTVEETFPVAGTAVVPQKMTRAEVGKILSGMAKVDSEMTEKMTEAMSGAAQVKTGTFRDGDSFHKGSGRGTVYRLADGAHVLRLENFKVTNGPALHVLLAAHPDPMKRADVKEKGYVDLGNLKGNIGNQNYPIPKEVDLTRQGSVIIYCVPFQVIFSVASLE